MQQNVVDLFDVWHIYSKLLKLDLDVAVAKVQAVFYN